MGCVDVSIREGRRMTWVGKKRVRKHGRKDDEMGSEEYVERYVDRTGLKLRINLGGWKMFMVP